MNNAFGALVDLASRSAEVWQELPAANCEQTHWTGLGFNVLGHRFVVPMDEVAELMRVPSATRLPGVKHFVVGVGNVRGRLMAILDLAMYFGEPSQLASSQRRVLAYEQDEHYVGFIIDESYGMQHFPSEAFDEDVSDVAEIFQPYLQGSYRVAGTQWPVLSLVALAEDPKLEKLALMSSAPRRVINGN